MPLIFAIESSCDETACALYDSDRKHLLAHRIHSQWRRHAPYGGIVPELASRDHLRRLLPMAHDILSRHPPPDAIAYTAGPGLAGALLAGATTAQALAFAWNLPVIPTNHLEGHLLSPHLLAAPPPFPYIALLASGGHTQLWRVRAPGDYHLMGDTMDDACGEAFDKSATLLGLGYPGGARLEQLAKRGTPTALTLPSPAQNAYDFSFSGLKTAVRRAVQQGHAAADIAAAFQHAVSDGLTRQLRRAIAAHGARHAAIVGGVAQNRHLQTALIAAAATQNAACHIPHPHHCGDNAAMIAVAAAHHSPIPAGGFDIHPRWDPGTPPSIHTAKNPAAPGATPHSAPNIRSTA